MAGLWDGFLGTGAQPDTTQPSGLWGKFLSSGQAAEGGKVSWDFVVNGLVQRGLSPVAAQGIAMNIADESGFNPGINEASPSAGRGGYGLIQWTGPRRAAYEAYAAQQGVPLSDPNAQLDYLVQELHGPEQASMQALSAAQTPGQAAAAFLNGNLRPAERYRAAREAAYTGANAPRQSTSPAQSGTMWANFLSGGANG